MLYRGFPQGALQLHAESLSSFLVLFSPFLFNHHVFPVCWKYVIFLFLQKTMAKSWFLISGETLNLEF